MTDLKAGVPYTLRTGRYHSWRHSHRPRSPGASVRLTAPTTVFCEAAVGGWPRRPIWLIPRVHLCPRGGGNGLSGQHSTRHDCGRGILAASEATRAQPISARATWAGNAFTRGPAREAAPIFQHIGGRDFAQCGRGATALRLDAPPGGGLKHFLISAPSTTFARDTKVSERGAKPPVRRASLSWSPSSFQPSGPLSPNPAGVLSGPASPDSVARFGCSGQPMDAATLTVGG